MAIDCAMMTSVDAIERASASGDGRRESVENARAVRWIDRRV
jgi:hypothetical protein